MEDIRTHLSPYITIERNAWSKLQDSDITKLIHTDLDKLKALNEPLTLEEVQTVYLPLSRLLNFYVDASRELYNTTDKFLHARTKKVPFIIGVAGSVAVGKSTTARVLRYLLSLWPRHPKVALVTTDGFLYPNKILEEKGIMNRKGFPESYDTKKLIHFLIDIKSGKSKVAAPVYSHLYYDVQKDKQQWIVEPDIVIVEGINVLQGRKPTAEAPELVVSDFFDFSIYVDAKVEYIKKWYLDRFETLRRTAFQDKDSYFHQFRHRSREEILQMAQSYWDEINQPNLDQNILPTRNRAKLILIKGPDHFVQKIKLRRL